MNKSIAILVTSAGMGNTAETPLKEKLATTFFQLVQNMEPKPKAICLYTEGVKLACEGSPFVELLKALENKGIRIILCQTCLNYFGLIEKTAVGIVGGMADILTVMWEADSVITV